MKKLLLLVVVVFATGCHIVPISSYSHQSSHGFSFYGEMTEAQVKIADEFIGVLPKLVIGSIHFINIVSNAEHYQSNRMWAGHCYPNGVICIKLRYITDSETLWHEIAHAYTFELMGYNSINLEKEWKAAAGKVYFGDDESPWEYPKNGLMTGYGRTDWMEDIAEYTCEFYLAITGHPSAFTRLTKEMRLEDKRYEEKLKLLLKYNFFTQSDYQKLCLKFPN